MLAEAERLEVKDKAALVLVELLMDEKVLSQIKQHRKLLLRVGIEYLIPVVQIRTVTQISFHIFSITVYCVTVLKTSGNTQ